MGAFDGLPPADAERLRQEVAQRRVHLEAQIEETMGLRATADAPGMIWREAIAGLLGLHPETIAKWAAIPRGPTMRAGRPSIGKLYAIHAAVLGAVGPGDGDMSRDDAKKLLSRRLAELATVLRIKSSTAYVLLGQADGMPIWFALSIRAWAAGIPVPRIFNEWSAPK